MVRYWLVVAAIVFVEGLKLFKFFRATEKWRYFQPDWVQMSLFDLAFLAYTLAQLPPPLGPLFAWLPGMDHPDAAAWLGGAVLVVGALYGAYILLWVFSAIAVHTWLRDDDAVMMMP